MQFSTVPTLQTASVIIPIRNCSSGETLRNRRCDVCPEGTYDLVGSGNCQPCPPVGLDCSAGGSRVVSRAGYWLLREGNSVQAFVCLEGYCLGNNTCAQFRDGVLCADCTNNRMNWGTQCVECNSTNGLLIAGLFFLAWFYVVVRHQSPRCRLAPPMCLPLTFPSHGRGMKVLEAHASRPLILSIFSLPCWKQALLWIGRSSSGKFKILIYFAQTVQLLLGPDSSLLSFFAVFNL